jgi:hypothetical protein
VPEDSIEEAGTMGEEEEAKHRRRDRQNDPSLVRHRTNKSSKSLQPPGLTDQEKNPNKPFNAWAVTRLKAQRPLGEWLGMTIFTFVGISSNLAAVTSSNEAGTMETQYWAWGFATMIGKFVHAITFHTRNAIVSLLIWNQVYISPAAAAVPSSTQPW